MVAYCPVLRTLSVSGKRFLHIAQAMLCKVYVRDAKARNFAANHSSRAKDSYIGKLGQELVHFLLISKTFPSLFLLFLFGIDFEDERV